jgi:hypothetical protein
MCRCQSLLSDLPHGVFSLYLVPAAFIILGRIAAYSDEATKAAWNRGEREVVISAALRR